MNKWEGSYLRPCMFIFFRFFCTIISMFSKRRFMRNIFQWTINKHVQRRERAFEAIKWRVTLEWGYVLHDTIYLLGVACFLHGYMCALLKCKTRISCGKRCSFAIWLFDKMSEWSCDFVCFYSNEIVEFGDWGFVWWFKAFLRIEVE